MGTRRQEAHELAARVKRVPSWKVTTPRSMSGAYKCTSPNGEVVQIHLSPSDTNFAEHVLRDLTSLGFLDDEAKWIEQRDREKAAQLEMQRKQAAARGAKLAAESASLQRAKGPYAAPEEVAYEWFAEKHPAPWVRWVIVTPELAARLLEHHNTDNRTLRPGTVNHYKAVILSGQWHLTHQGMAMDQRGIVQDGQHRLAAIRDSGVPCPVAFFVGMPIENFKAIDEGLLRRAADLIGKDGTQYAALSASIMKLIDAFDATEPRRVYHQKMTNESVYDMVQLDAENIRDSVRYGSSHYKKCKMNATGLGGAHYLIRKHNGRDNVYVEAFFYGLSHGIKGDTRIVLDDDDPRTKLRELFTNWREKGKRINALDNCALIVMTWNFVVSNHRPRFMRLADNMEIPKISKCAPEGKYASAVPEALMLETQFAARALAEQRAAAIAA